MKSKTLLTLGLVATILSSCGTPKDIAYFQDVVEGETELRVAQPVEITIRPKDKLFILVSSQDPRLTNQFNLPVISQQVGLETSAATSRGVTGYTVNSDGDIDFPVLGKIHVAGLTREQVAKKIKEELVSHDLIKDPVVTVEFMNLNISVLGEVHKPGRIEIDKDKVTILDALSAAGDLTINGRRNTIMVLRQEDGVQKGYSVDLTSAANVYSSPVYYLKQNDVIYVEPNDYMKRQSTVNGNNVRSVSFWMSLASLLVSVAVLIK